MDIFLAGYNEIEGYEGVWVASMGHLMGLFDRPWLGIPPTQKLIMLRYCEFNKVSNGKISETYDEKKLKEYMQWGSIEIEVNLKLGNDAFRCYTCDFTHDYIDINADYRN